jgi:hypothetical protein
VVFAADPLRSVILVFYTGAATFLSRSSLFILNPLWSTGQSSWLQTQRSRVRLPALQEFPRSSGSGTESTQPREDK